MLYRRINQKTEALDIFETCYLSPKMLAWMILSMNQLQVLNSIILSITIYMMDVFVCLKISTNMISHDQTMFCNISVLVSHGMFTVPNLNVTVDIPETLNRYTSRGMGFGNMVNSHVF